VTDALVGLAGDTSLAEVDGRISGVDWLLHRDVLRSPIDSLSRRNQ